MTWMDKTMVGMRSPEKGKKSDHDTTNDNHCVIVNGVTVMALFAQGCEKKFFHEHGVVKVVPAAYDAGFCCQI